MRTEQHGPDGIIEATEVFRDGDAITYRRTGPDADAEVTALDLEDD